MKAKDYANEFFIKLGNDNSEDNIKTAVSHILIMFLKEGKEIAEARKATTDEAGIAILKELSDKWRSFANHINKYFNKYFKTNVVKTDGYKEFIISQFPELKGRF